MGQRLLVTLECRAEHIHVDACCFVAELRPDRRPAAEETGSAQNLHGAEEVAYVHENVHVGRIPLPAVLDHGEATDDREGNPRVAQQTTYPLERLVRRSGAALPYERVPE